MYILVGDRLLTNDLVRYDVVLNEGIDFTNLCTDYLEKGNFKSASYVSFGDPNYKDILNNAPKDALYFCVQHEVIYKKNESNKWVPQNGDIV